MIEGAVGEYESQDIRAVVDRILRDLDNPEPPLNLNQVRYLLKLDIGYYSSTNTTLLQDITHRLKMAGKQVLSRPTILLDVVRKAKLSALWVPDTKRILIDETTPKPKHRWMEGHEIGHSIIPWHRDFLFGDNEYTLDPVCHAIVEAEANYAASRLLFLQGRFAADARDVELSFKSINSLAKRYGNTITSTLWRIVEDREPNRPIFGMVTAHPNYPEIGSGEDGKEVRYFIRSAAFRQQFSTVTAEQGYALIKAHATWRKSGPIVNALAQLSDINGIPHEFRVESFCNSHAVLTYAVLVRPKPTLVSMS